MKRNESIIVLVECPDGTTFTQELEIIKNDISKTILEYSKVLGYGYMICSWWYKND